MNTHADKTQENKSQSVSNDESRMKSRRESTFQLVNNRPEVVTQRKLQSIANNNPGANYVAQLSTMESTSGYSVVQRAEKSEDEKEEAREEMKVEFMNRLDNLQNKIPQLKGQDIQPVGEALWLAYSGEVMGERGMQKNDDSAEEVNVNTQVPSEQVDGREIRKNEETNPAYYPSSKNHNAMKKGGKYVAVMSESFNLLTNALKGLSQMQFSQSDEYAFWNGTGAKDVAMGAPGLALESSIVGSLFDNIGSYMNGVSGAEGWDPHLWTELSRTYASMVINEVIKDSTKRINVMCGIGFDNPGYNIWNSIESRTLQLGVDRANQAREMLENATTYYAVAEVKGVPKTVDLNQSLDGIKGVYAKACTATEIVDIQAAQKERNR